MDFKKSRSKLLDSIRGYAWEFLGKIWKAKVSHSTLFLTNRAPTPNAYQMVNSLTTLFGRIEELETFTALLASSCNPISSSLFEGASSYFCIRSRTETYWRCFNHVISDRSSFSHVTSNHRWCSTVICSQTPSLIPSISLRKILCRMVSDRAALGMTPTVYWSTA